MVMFSYLASKQNNRLLLESENQEIKIEQEEEEGSSSDKVVRLSEVSSNSNRQTSYSNDDSRVNKHINYRYFHPSQMTQPQSSQSQYEYADSEPRQHFENRDRQNQSFRLQQEYESADREPRQHFENRDRQNQSFRLQQEYESADREPRQHFESRDRQNHSFRLQQEYESADREPRQHFENRDRQNQSFRLQQEYESADREPRQHFENRDRQNQSFRLQQEYESADREPRQHFESRDRQNHSFRLQQEYEYADREPQPHIENRDRQNQSFWLQQDRGTNLESNSERNGERKNSSNHFASNIDNKSYTCPSCNLPFDYRNRSGRYTGKLPLILNCNHTVCQECIYKGAVEDNIICPICKNPSALIDKNHIETLYEAFSPNFYIFGMISFSKGKSCNSDSLSLVPVEETKRNHNSGLLMERKQDIGQRCFLSCNNEANLRCEDCNDFYCTNCFTVVHKFTKSFSMHTQVPITQEKPTCELERCTLDNMDIEEFFCKKDLKDNLSKGYSDSGKGGSDMVTPPPSRTPGLDVSSSTIQSFYDFVMPQSFVGKLIGPKGSFVTQIKNQTNAMIIVKPHPSNSKLRICSVEGTKQDIENALKMVRDKFPAERYSEVTLEQVHLTPVISTNGGSKKGGGKKAGGIRRGGKKGGSSYIKTFTLSPELAALVGQDTMTRHEVVKKIWSIIKEKDLYDPDNKAFAICDDALMKVIGVRRFRTFHLFKFLKKHLT